MHHNTRGHSRILAALTLIVGMLASTSAVAQERDTPSPLKNQSPCELSIVTTDDGALTASCIAPGSDRPGSSRLTSKTSDGETRAVVAVSSGQTVIITRSSARATIEIGGGPLKAATVDAAQDLRSQLERTFDPQTLTDEEDLALRLANFVGAAYEGYDRQRITVARPTVRAGGIIDTTAGDVLRTALTSVVAGIPSTAVQRLCAAATSALAPTLASAACDRTVNGGEGLRYISCNRGNRATHHDSPNHCYNRYSVASGPCTSNCRGRCGAGCPIVGKFGSYTKDCLDHDYCETHHNPGGGHCGDELDEAIDDFAFAGYNCDGCNNPH